jgi:predicted ATP-binding protein involved in virulence
MKVRSLDVEGFRGFAHPLHIDFDERLTVLVGENGRGKTSLLDALAILLDQYLARLLRGSARSAKKLTDKDVHHSGPYPLALRTPLGAAYLEIATAWGDRDVSWSVYNGSIIPPKNSEKDIERSNSRKSAFDELNLLIEECRSETSSIPDCAPLIIYYGQRRAVLSFPLRIRSTAKMEPEAAFRQALTAGDLDFREFIAWFRDRSLSEAQHWKTNQSYRDKQLEAVRRAMIGATGLTDPIYSMEAPQGLRVTKNCAQLPVNQLSSGEQTFLALAGDLARRLAMLNPDMDDPLQGQGIVLIDEIELHLHPRWQRVILPWLLETFPNCQFIVTTHSPQVLGRVKAEQIRILEAQEDGRVEVRQPRAVWGRDSNFILAAVLGADERDSDLKDRLDALEKSIGDGNLEEATRALEELRREFEAEPPELTIAQARLERRLRNRSQ